MLTYADVSILLYQWLYLRDRYMHLMGQIGDFELDPERVGGAGGCHALGEGGGGADGLAAGAGVEQGGQGSEKARRRAQVG
jgi:hypothetical protein